MKTIKVLMSIGKGYLYLVGFFFVLMAFDCFGPVGCPNCDSFWQQLLCFIMSILPGLIVVALAFFLGKKEKILGIILIVLAIVAFFFFKFYREFLEKIPIFIIITVIPILIGIVFILASSFVIEEEK